VAVAVVVGNGAVAVRRCYGSAYSVGSRRRTRDKRSRERRVTTDNPRKRGEVVTYRRAVLLLHRDEDIIIGGGGGDGIPLMNLRPYTTTTPPTQHPPSPCSRETIHNNII